MIHPNYQWSFYIFYNEDNKRSYKDFFFDRQESNIIIIFDKLGKKVMLLLLFFDKLGKKVILLKKK